MRKLIIILLIIPVQLFATNYYVKNGGNNSANGLSDANAWANISKVNSSSFSPGDSILFRRGDTWREELIVPSSGTKGNSIIFGAYGTGAKPKLYRSIQAITWTNVSGNIWQSATSMTDPYHSSSYAADYPATIWFENTDNSITWGTHVINTGALMAEYQWVWVSNVLYIYAATDPDSRYTAIECPQGDYPIYLNTKDYLTFDNLDLRYCILAGIKESYNGAERHGLEVKNCDISYNSIQEGLVGYGISSAYSNSRYYNNTIHDCGRRCISVNAQVSGQVCDSVTIENNTIYDSFHSGIDVSAINSSHITYAFVRNNYCYQSTSWPLWTWAGTMVPIYSGIGNGGTTSNIYIYNNLIINFRREAIISELSNYVYIYNNTIVSGDNSSYLDQSGHVYFQGSTNNYLYNNIFYNGTPNDGNAAHTQYSVIVANTSTSTSHLDNNLYYNADANAYFMMFSTSSSYKINQFATYKTAKSQDLNSPSPANPSFVSSSDFHLNAGSPAIGEATTPLSLTDYSGNTWDNPPSIGAYKYGASSPVPVTSITVSGAGGASTISTPSGTLQLSTSVLPADASNKTVTWSRVNGSGSASISSGGLVTAIADGTVTATATANDGSGVHGDLILTISNQTSVSNTRIRTSRTGKVILSRTGKIIR